MKSTLRVAGLAACALISGVFYLWQRSFAAELPAAIEQPESPQTAHLKIRPIESRLETVIVPMPARVTSELRTKTNLRSVLVQRGVWRQRIQKVRTIDKKRHIVSEKFKKGAFYNLMFLNEKGKPVKKYNLLKAKKVHMLATGYYVGDPMVPGDHVKLGYKLRRGFVAVDPKVIPLRSRLYIPGYGYAFAADTGSAIKGMRVDLAVKDKHEEARYNHRNVTIYVLDKTWKW